jgi:hypothetical protein
MCMHRHVKCLAMRKLTPIVIRESSIMAPIISTCGDIINLKICWVSFSEMQDLEKLLGESCGELSDSFDDIK